MPILNHIGHKRVFKRNYATYVNRDKQNRDHHENKSHPNSKNDFEVKNKTKVDQEQNEPQYQTFQDFKLRRTLVDALESMNISEPSQVQKSVIPKAMRGKDIIFGAPTGTGKTLSFLLPAIHRMKMFEAQNKTVYHEHQKKIELLDKEHENVLSEEEQENQEEHESNENEHNDNDKKNKTNNNTASRKTQSNHFDTKLSRPKVLILVPSRELAIQVAQVSKYLSHYVKYRSVLLLRSERWKTQRNRLNAPIDVLITTPGTFLQHRDAGRVFYTDIRTVIVDEADTLLSKGFRKEVMSILEPCQGVSKSRHNVQFLFSMATLSKNVENYLLKQFPSVYKEIVPLTSFALPNITHEFRDVPAMHAHSVESNKSMKNENVGKQEYDKFSYVAEYIKKSVYHEDQVLVFCNTVKSCRAAHRKLEENRISAACYHSEMPQPLRSQHFSDFMSRQYSVMVCTDIAGRGLDTVSVSKIINADFPLSPIDYIHRAGRSGRMGRSGKVVNFLLKRDRVLAKAIQYAIKKNDPLDALSSDKEDEYNRKAMAMPGKSSSEVVVVGPKQKKQKQNI